MVLNKFLKISFCHTFYNSIGFKDKICTSFKIKEAVNTVIASVQPLSSSYWVPFLEIKSSSSCNSWLNSAVLNNAVFVLLKISVISVNNTVQNLLNYPGYPTIEVPGGKTCSFLYFQFLNRVRYTESTVFKPEAMYQFWWSDSK